MAGLCLTDLVVHQALVPLAAADVATTTPDWVDRAAYPFAPHWFEGPDGRQHYLDEGRGEVLLLVHGTPTWSFEWRHVVTALSGRYRLVAPDHLGFGLSAQPRGADYSPAAHARRFAAFAEGLELDRVTLVVHDYGGPIALPWAAAHPERVRRLVVLNSWMWPFDDDPLMARRARMAGSAFGRWLYRWANASLRLITPSAYGDRKKLTPAIHRQYLAPFRARWSRGEILWPLARGLLGAGDQYRALWAQRSTLAQLPSLVVWGMKDSAFQPYNLERWREALPGAKTVELSGAGHWPHEEEPGPVNQALGEFLQG
jgi:haloalkane dehalogenase